MQVCLASLATGSTSLLLACTGLAELTLIPPKAGRSHTSAPKRGLEPQTCRLNVYQHAYEPYMLVAFLFQKLQSDGRLRTVRSPAAGVDQRGQRTSLTRLRPFRRSYGVTWLSRAAVRACRL
jgi:hypothetical protein